MSSTLTPRELEVLKLIAEGNGNKQIAARLDISDQTVENHVTAMLHKLRANDRTHAVVTALRCGLISLGTLPKVLDETFSFTENIAPNVVNQTAERVLLILLYELGRVAELHHKTELYGPQGYLGDAKYEMSDLISMTRLYCERMHWNFRELMALGEERYLDRMEDIRKHGIEEQITKG